MPSKAIQKTYTETEVVGILTALAKCSGNPINAAALLKKEGVKLNQTDIRRVKTEHYEMYVALAADYSKAIEDGIAQKYRELAAAASNVTAEFVEKIHDDLQTNGLPENPERMLMALTRVQQVSTDKLLSITGRPVGGQATDPMEAARELVRLGVLKPVEQVDGTAEEDE